MGPLAVQLGMRALPIAFRVISIGSAAAPRATQGLLANGWVKAGLAAVGISSLLPWLIDSGVPDTVANAVDHIVDDMDALQGAGMLYVPEPPIWTTTQAMREQLNYTVIENTTGLVALVDNKRFWPQRFFRDRG